MIQGNGYACFRGCVCVSDCMNSTQLSSDDDRTPPVSIGGRMSTEALIGGKHPTAPRFEFSVTPSRDEEPRSQSSIGRWVPPALRRDALAQESPENIIFRKVRGILNKLTPEKFHKLSSDLLQIELTTSEYVLKGIIFLIFEKALEEPKYSSMYAKLCKRLKEEVSERLNNEDRTNPTLFEILLANTCRQEFQSRSNITEGLEKSGIVTAEDEEKLQIAKRKMLGNIRFIGELGKLGVVPDSTLHRCIYQLLQRICKNNGKDKVEDMECLCQIMRTCGRILDSGKSQNFMNQYFERMEKLAAKTDFPQRIRFMLQDVIELRKNQWIPRKATSAEGPMPMAQIFDEEQSNNGTVGFKSLLTGQLSGQRGGFMNQQTPDLFRRPLKMREDMLSSPFPTSHQSHDKFNSFNLNGFNSGGGLGYRNQGRQNHFISSSMGNSMQSAHQPNYYQNRSNYNNNQHNNNNNNGTNNTNKDIAPRFKKLLQQGSNLEDVSLRPPANSMICKPPNNLKPSSTMTNNMVRPSSLMTEPIMVTPPMKAAPMVQTNKDPVILIKPAANDKSKVNKKEKNLTKEEIMKKVSSLAKSLAENGNVDEAVNSFRELKITDHLVPEAINTLLTHLINKTENNQELAAKFVIALKKGNHQPSAQQFLKCFKTLLNSMSSKDNSFNFIQKAAGLAGYIIASEENLLKLNNIVDLSDNGKYFPLCILTLQILSKVLGKPKLTQIFKESKINLLNTLPEAERSKERLGEILDEYELTYLIPLLRIQAELWKQVQADPNPAQLYKWIKESLDPAHHSDPGFINALVTVLVKYITESMSASGEGLDSNQVPDKVAQDKEKQLLEKFKPILQAFLHERVDLQVIAVYALQVHCHSHDFPKGMLLRWFNNFYNFEIVEEEAFLKWREDDVSDVYPGKGKALFQVNNWLTWLAEAEEEEEEEEEDEDEEEEPVEEIKN